MATLPIRELGKIGIVADANPYDLPSNAFNDGNNVIFDEGRISRAPVFKQLYPAVKSSKTWADFGSTTWDAATVTYESAEGSPTDGCRFVGSYAEPSNGEVVFVADNDGTVRAYPNSVLVNVTPTGVTLVNNEEAWSHAEVGGVSILARKDMVPYAKNLTTDTAFKSLGTSNWGTTTTCAVMRSYNDFFVALNVTKGVNTYPTMVKWCDPVQYGSAVTALDWNAASTTNNAGENVLGEMTSPIMDGLKLGTQFMIYSRDQVWIMEYTGSELVFNFRRLFPTGGVINTNCVVEVEGKHFVFGVDDIYVHDGATKKSIADGRVRRKIFKNLDPNKVKNFHVTHDTVANFIYFCYYTRQNEANFKDTQFCNKAAIYNYREDTWSFMDLPNVVGGAQARVTLTKVDYADVNDTYQNYNTSFLSFETGSPTVPIMLGVTDTGNGLTESRVYAIDLPTVGAVSLPASMETFKPAYVARTGIDLDEMNLELRGYKYVNSVTPQAEFEVTDGVFHWEIGSTDLPGGSVVYQTTYDYRPDADYQISTRAYGRYLAYRISTSNIENFRISGFDADVRSFNKR